MPRPHYDCISLLPDGKYKIVRTTGSGDVSAPLISDRVDLEQYLRDGAIVGSTPEEVLRELDKAGYVETTLRH
jgi:hypothetical protein